MMEGIRLSAAGARLQGLVHEVIANNLANVNTVGFRKQVAVAAADGGSRDLTTSGIGYPVPPSASLDTLLSPAQGPIEQTGRQTDLAIEGEGFFVVSDGQQRYYTRDGRFTLSEDGRLVTLDGRFALLDVDGQPIHLDRTRPFTVTGKGEVVQGGAVVGRLALVTFRHPEDLRPAGGGRFIAPPGARPVPARAAVVHQGFLEGSNVQAVRELVAMLEAFRAYEANVNLITQQDATLRRLITEAARGV